MGEREKEKEAIICLCKSFVIDEKNATNYFQFL